MSEVLARLAEHGCEGSADVPATASIGSHGGHREGIPAARPHHRGVRLLRGAGGGVQGDRRTRGRCDPGELATQVEDAARGHDRAHRAVRDPQVVAENLRPHGQTRPTHGQRKYGNSEHHESRCRVRKRRGLGNSLGGLRANLHGDPPCGRRSASTHIRG